MENANTPGGLKQGEIAVEPPPQNPKELLMRLIDRFGKAQKRNNRIVLARNVFYTARPYMKEDKRHGEFNSELAPLSSIAYLHGITDNLYITGPLAITAKIERMNQLVREYQKSVDTYENDSRISWMHPIYPDVLPMVKAGQLASEIVGDVLSELEKSGFFAGEQLPKIILSQHDEDSAGFRPVR